MTSHVADALKTLSINHSDEISHGPTTKIEEWRAELGGTSFKPDYDHSLTKVQVLKPKTPKSQTAIYIVVVALDSTETPAAAVSKLIDVKEARGATDEAITEVLGIPKADVSPFSITKTNAQAVQVVLDQKLVDFKGKVGVHTTSSEKTLFLSGSDIVKYLESTGVKTTVVDFSAATSAGASNPVGKSETKTAPKPVKEDATIEGAALIGIGVQKELDFSGWYQQVLTKGDMLDYYDVSGCYILKPWSYQIWEHIQDWFNAKIKDLGVENCYFPMFVSKRVLEREKDHIEGFAPEVAWVTKAGDKELEEHIAIRPTSETVMYPYYAKWIKSHRDLPLRLNQWNSVVRWEFKHPQPFLRTREFLWQEGHTAHLTREGAEEEVLQILDFYAGVYEELLAVPVIKGKKTEKEKFAGGFFTTTVEGYIPTTGRGIQGGTSHCLGQNFSKMFGITVENPNAKEGDSEDDKLFVWQNSWGLSTRVIGVMVMVHGDNKGLVLPPRVAALQVVIVPCGLTAKTTKKERETIFDEVDAIAKTLKKSGIRVRADLRDTYSPGYKFNDWELKGVPLRLEYGPKDSKNKQVTAVRRDKSDISDKAAMPLEGLSENVSKLLETIQSDMFAKAKKSFDDNLVIIDKWDDFVPHLNDKKVIMMPFCLEEACEDDIKERSKKVDNDDTPEDSKAPSMGAKSLCRPFDQPKGLIPGKTKCLACGMDAKEFTLFGRSY